MKFNTHHFPQGTTFTLDEKVCAFLEVNPDEVFEVNRIHILGGESFLLETTDFKIIGKYGEEVPKQFASGYVGRILKRGKGPMKVVGLFPHESAEGQWESVIDYFEASQDDFKSQNITRKGVFTTRDVELILTMNLSRLSFSSEARFDIKRMTHTILKQTWVKKLIRKGSNIPPIYQINKKRLNEWLRANYNRYLLRA